MEKQIQELKEAVLWLTNSLKSGETLEMPYWIELALNSGDKMQKDKDDHEYTADNCIDYFNQLSNREKKIHFSRTTVISMVSIPKFEIVTLRRARG